MNDTWWYDAVDGRVSADREAFRALVAERDRLTEALAQRDAGIARLRTTSQGHYDDALAARDEVAALRRAASKLLEATHAEAYTHPNGALLLMNAEIEMRDTINASVAALATPPIDSARQEAEHALCEASERLYEGCRVDAENGDALVSVQPQDWAAWVHALDRWADARDDNLRVPSVATGAKEE